MKKNITKEISNDETVQLHEEILKRVDMTQDIEDEKLMELIHAVLEERGRKNYISLKKKARLGKELFNTFRKLDILQEIIEDDDITEIMINGTKCIFIEKEGRIQKLDKHFVTKSKLEDVIQQIVASANRIVNEATPIVDARLPDGSRVNVVLYPVALDGPIVTIRKFPKRMITMQELILRNSINQEIAQFMEKLVVAGYNIFVSGGTGSG